MTDIKKILNQKGWTGRELGIILITNFCEQYKQIQQGEKIKPIIEKCKLTKMINDNIKTQKDENDFNNYDAIYRWLFARHAISETQTQQAQISWYTIRTFVREAIAAEGVFKYINKLRALMTQKQLEEIDAEDKPFPLVDISLESFFPESEDYAINTEIVLEARETLINSFYFLLCYSYAIDRTSKIHDVPALEFFKADIDFFVERIDLLNRNIETLQTMIEVSGKLFKNKELEQKKLNVLKEFFQPIDYKTLIIPDEIKEEMEKLITDFSAFKIEKFDYFYKLLCMKPVRKEV